MTPALQYLRIDHIIYVFSLYGHSLGYIFWVSWAEPEDWVWVPALTISLCESLGKLFNFSVFQFPHP